MKCPVCGAAELIHDTRNMPYIYKGEATTIPSVTGDFCPSSELVNDDGTPGDINLVSVGVGFCRWLAPFSAG